MVMLTTLIKKKSPPPSRGRVREGVESQAPSVCLNLYPLPSPLPARERELNLTTLSTPPHFYMVFNY